MYGCLSSHKVRVENVDVCSLPTLMLTSCERNDACVSADSIQEVFFPNNSCKSLEIVRASYVKWNITSSRSWICKMEM